MLLAYCPSIRESWVYKLMQGGIEIDDIVKMTAADAATWGLTSEIYGKFNAERTAVNLMEKIAELKKLDISFITCEDSAWPKILNNLNPAPLWLFVRGPSEILKAKNLIGFVGTRKLSPYGQLVSKNLATWLTEAGATIVSGLAFGADAISHKCACDHRLPSIAVLASSCDEASLYPQSHVPLSQKIIECGGAIISEWPPYFHPQGYHFPYRNRLIAGLSKAVVISEAPIKSGTLHTAKWALDLGVPIGAVPGDITRDSASGTNFLISNGATALCTKEDVLQFAGLEDKISNSQLSMFDENMSELAKKIWNNLTESKTFDQISIELNLPSPDLLIALTELEIADRIAKSSNHEYSKK